MLLACKESRQKADGKQISRLLFHLQGTEEKLQ